MEVRAARLGFCMGIDRAYRRMSRRAEGGDLLTATHQNSANGFDTLRRIARRDPDLMRRYPGLDKVDVKLDLEAIGAGERVVLGFHGLPREAKAGLAARGAELVDDLMCPFIAKLDRVVERHVAGGSDVAMVGSPGNHHVRTAQEIAAGHGRTCYTISRLEDLDALPRDGRRQIVLVGQVTGDTELFGRVIARIEAARLPIKVVKTMCADSHARQREAAQLAEEADVVLLLDDGGDAARSVLEVCARRNRRVHRIRGEQDVRPGWLAGARVVGIIGGIMMPDWTIESVARHVRSLAVEAPGAGPAGP